MSFERIVGKTHLGVCAPVTAILIPDLWLGAVLLGSRCGGRMSRPKVRRVAQCSGVDFVLAQGAPVHRRCGRVLFERKRCPFTERLGNLRKFSVNVSRSRHDGPGRQFSGPLRRIMMTINRGRAGRFGKSVTLALILGLCMPMAAQAERGSPEAQCRRAAVETATGILSAMGIYAGNPLWSVLFRHFYNSTLRSCYS